MANIALSWREAAILSAVLFGLTLLFRSSAAGVLKSVAPFAREIGVLAGLYALWQFAGTPRCRIRRELSRGPGG